ncbi:putative orfan [Tupanvirus soda lake]|uniref:Orfan n=2 Tax=Tupanvirus TaxID=2094720 RepID=A0AC62ADN5_9VIRU|nr:putative orfan [Tupanvirus soda lake]QKU35882.1 putative orfan [Tupanvirus soda lake]
MSYLVNIRLVLRPTPKHFRVTKNSFTGPVRKPVVSEDGYDFPPMLDLIHNPKKKTFVPKSAEEEYKSFPSTLKMIHGDD